MKISTKFCATAMIAVSCASALAEECYLAKDNSPGFEYRYCKGAQKGGWQRTIDWTSTIIGTQPGGFATTSDGSGRKKNFHYGRNVDFTPNGNSGVKVTAPSQVGGVRTKEVEWVKTGGRVQCGKKARWELRANMENREWRIEGRAVGKSWMNFGNVTQEHFKNGQVGLRVIGDANGVKC